MDDDYRQGLVHVFHEGARAALGDGAAAILIARASGQTLEGISQWFGITRERVRQIETEALRDLPEEPFLLLTELAELTPEPVSVLKNTLTERRAKIKEYIAQNPAKAYNYQKLHLACGVKAPTDKQFLGPLALVQLYADYHIVRIGDEYHCTCCGHFKHKSEFNPAAERNPLSVLLCRTCNTARHKKWYARHLEHARAYAKMRNNLPMQKVYVKRWQEKKLAEDPDYFKKKQREKLAKMTPEQRTERNTRAYYRLTPEQRKARNRQRYERMKRRKEERRLGLV